MTATLKRIKISDIKGQKKGQMGNSIKFASIILFLSVLIILVSCEKRKAVWKGTIEEENGVTIVKNPKKPIYGEDVLSMKEDLTLGEKEGREEYIFSGIHGIQYIDVDDNENIYILDDKVSNIRVFDKNGKHLKTIGKIGQGPGEFQRPAYFIQVTPQKEIMVYDPPTRRFVLFSLEGEYLKQISDARIGGVPTEFKKNSRGNYVGCILKGPPAIELKMFDSNLQPGLTIFLESEKPSPKGELTVLRPHLYFALTRNDDIIWGFSDKYEIQVVDFKGELKRRIIKDYKPVKINEKEKEIIRERYGRLATLGMRYKLDFPKYFPPFNSMTVDEEGRIFVGTYEKTKYDWEYHDVFDAEGRYIARVPLRAIPYVWKKNKMYSIYRDEEGYTYVKRFKIQWNINL